MQNDSLYRISLKCFIKNDKGEVLVVKEAGRVFWDLPGGGIDYGESIRSAISRELMEEVGYEGDFSYRILTLDEPRYLLTRNVWQTRVIFEVEPSAMNFSVGADADEIQFVVPSSFEKSEHYHEQKIYEYANLMPGIC